MDSLPPDLTDELTDFLLSNPTPEQIIAFRASPAVNERASWLLERNREGTMTRDERDEMEAYRYADYLVTVLKAKARLKR